MPASAITIEVRGGRLDGLQLALEHVYRAATDWDHVELVALLSEESAVLTQWTAHGHARPLHRTYRHRVMRRKDGTITHLVPAD
jgi:hypothetical protein